MSPISIFAGENVDAASGDGGLLWLIVPVVLVLVVSSFLHRLYRKISQLRSTESDSALSAAEAYAIRREKQIWVEGLDPETGVYFITAARENYWPVSCDSRRHFLRSHLLWMDVEQVEGPGTATCRTCGRTIQIVKLNRIERRHPGRPEIGCSRCGSQINIENITSCGVRRCDSCGTLIEIFETGDEYAERLARSTKRNQKSGLNSLANRQEGHPSLDATSDIYTYRNAPNSAVSACVKALESEGVTCNPANFEADVERIITAAKIDEDLERQFAQWPKEAAELLAKMESPDELASGLMTKKIASIIRNHLGPWLK